MHGRQSTHQCSKARMRGLACKCPRCGKGKLYAGFLTLRPACENCGLDYAFIDSGDGPAVFIIMIAGAIVVGLRADRRDKIPAAVLAACRIVAAADSGDHAVAAALDEGAADRAAIPSQGRGRPADRSRAVMTVVSATPARRRRPWNFHAPDAGAADRPRRLAVAAPGREACADRAADRAPRRSAGSAAVARAVERADAGARRISPRAFFRDLRAASGRDGLQFRLRDPRRRFRPRHLGLPAGAAAERRDRRDQRRLRAKHHAGPRPAGSRGGAARHRRAGDADGLHPLSGIRRRADAAGKYRQAIVVHARSSGDRARARLGRGRAVLYRSRNPGAGERHSRSRGRSRSISRTIICNTPSPGSAWPARC